jgi:RNA ligase (TIGR02306 family)
MRKLVTLQTIKDIRPIQNADAIEVATVLGWNVVVKKGEFSIGDKAIYFEIDSFLPCEPHFEFLRKGCYKQLPDGTEGFRLRTVRLRGQLSQGLLLPLQNFPDIDFSGMSIGDEVTELLGVTKYEPPMPAVLAGDAKGLFPSFIQKTDQERIQNLYDDYKSMYADEEFEVTVKLDGSSATYYFKDGEFGVCSRNLELKETEGNSFWKIARSYDIEGYLRDCHRSEGMNLAIQGELIGEGIQGNREGLRGQQFYVFDIYNIDDGRYLTPDERNVFCPIDQDYSWFLHVPRLQTMKPFQMSLDELLEFANGPSLNNPIREGLVFKSVRPLPPTNQIVTFKVISNKYLENGGE